MRKDDSLFLGALALYEGPLTALGILSSELLRVITAGKSDGVRSPPGGGSNMSEAHACDANNCSFCCWATRFANV